MGSRSEMTYDEYEAELREDERRLREELAEYKRQLVPEVWSSQVRDQLLRSMPADQPSTAGDHRPVFASAPRQHGKLFSKSHLRDDPSRGTTWYKGVSIPDEVFRQLQPHQVEDLHEGRVDALQVREYVATMMGHEIQDVVYRRENNEGVLAHLAEIGKEWAGE